MNTKISTAAPLLLIAEAVGAAPGDASTRLVESPLSPGNLINTGVGLLVVLGIMLALAWLVKRYVQVPGIGKGQVQVLGGVSLGAREKAVLLSVEGQRLLVGIAPGRVQTLMILGGEAVRDGAFAEQLEDATAGIDAVTPGDKT
jgi:flagellar protein FliO/FliZ